MFHNPDEEAEDDFSYGESMEGLDREEKDIKVQMIPKSVEGEIKSEDEGYQGRGRLCFVLCEDGSGQWPCHSDEKDPLKIKKVKITGKGGIVLKQACQEDGVNGNQNPGGVTSGEEKKKKTSYFNSRKGSK